MKDGPKINDGSALRAAVARSLNGKKNIKILEAGCGSMSHLGYTPDAYVVGIDISEKQLRENTLLRERILGDLQTYELPPKEFDYIVCWDVLEHLPRPRAAIERLLGAVKDDGIVLLASPNVMTLRGLVTKFTPHWVHVWYYRHIVKYPLAGTEGTWPFKAYHRFSIAPENIARYARDHGFEVDYTEYHGLDHPEKGLALTFMIWKLANQCVRALTLGKIGTDEKECFKLILKRARTA